MHGPEHAIDKKFVEWIKEIEGDLSKNVPRRSGPGALEGERSEDHETDRMTAPPPSPA